MSDKEKIIKQEQLLHTIQYKEPTQEELDEFLVELLAEAIRNFKKLEKKKN